VKDWRAVLHAAWWEAVQDALTPREAGQIQALWETAHRDPDVVPPPEEIFTVLEALSLDRVRVVILGQDPYHGVGQAHGLAFSVRHGQAHPPSLRNVLKELAADVPVERWMERPEGTGVLSGWVAQGVLLLNVALTVRLGQAGAFRGQGWEALTGALIDAVCRQPQPVAFLLWGKPAAAFASRVHRPEHRVFIAPHPSPLSAHRGYFGSRPFSQANAWLKACGAEPVDWWRGIPNP
jgi:uracil-DNA glycosylase